MSTPTGLIAIVEDRVRNMIADSAEWRSWCNETTRATALAHVYSDMTPDPANGFEYTAAEYEAMCPFAIVTTSMTDGYRMIPMATDVYQDGGEILIELCDVPGAGLSVADANRAFKEHISLLMFVDFLALGKLSNVSASGGSYMFPGATALVRGPERTLVQEADSKGDIIQALFSVQWGVS